MPVVEGPFDLIFDFRDLGPLHPAAIRPMARRLIDICDLIPCDGSQPALDPGTSLGFSVEMAMDLGGLPAMEQGMVFHTAIMDESGRVIASGQSHFDNRNTEPQADEQAAVQTVDLSFELVPSYAWRNSGKYGSPDQTDVAVPAYYLIITPDIGDEKNQEVLSKVPLKVNLLRIQK